MTPLPLEEIGLRGRHHRSALWWLGLLYRRPKQLNDRLKELNKSQAAHASAVLYLHALPYIVLLSIIGRWLLFSVFGLELERSLAIYNISPILLHILFLITGIWLAMIIGVVFGLFALTNKWVIICVYSSPIPVVEFLNTNLLFQ
ncbi:MAG: hypothetical protein RKO66_04365, partial [Candidatus Contendobacter sp.]|nr:hypothetical protein [Candidatus Contendobacter sp.]MDS4057745.1 hypothetical protein [Candidatus Contendobacter sp.]